MDAIERRMFGFWFTRRQEGRKKGQALKAVFVPSCLGGGTPTRNGMPDTHSPEDAKPEQRMKILLDKTNLIGYQKQRFLTLFPESRARNGTRGRSA